jgi:hypothetical protein
MTEITILMKRAHFYEVISLGEWRFLQMRLPGDASLCGRTLS